MNVISLIEKNLVPTPFYTRWFDYASMRYKYYSADEPIALKIF